MFRDDDQIRQCCDMLMKRAGLPAWWKDNNIQQAADFLSGPRPSRAQRALVGVAFALWNGDGDAQIASLLHLSTSDVRAVASLLVAVREGHDAIERWLELARQGTTEPPAPKNISAPTPPRHLKRSDSLNG